MRITTRRGGVRPATKARLLDERGPLIDELVGLGFACVLAANMHDFHRLRQLVGEPQSARADTAPLLKRHDHDRRLQIARVQRSAVAKLLLDGAVVSLDPDEQVERQRHKDQRDPCPLRGISLPE